MYIAVSGNLGSGKTTIARGLAKAFNCDVYPQTPYDESYIEDLFREPGRWTTEAQISFLFHKYEEVRAGLKNGRLFVLDRSFDEEVEIFAKRFHDGGVIDDRGIALLQQLASDLGEKLEPPSVIVMCDCPVPVCQERLNLRPRKYQAHYPQDHLDRIHARLSAWISMQTEIPVLKIDTGVIDCREPEAINTLAKQVDELLMRRGRGDQMDLFSGELNSDLKIVTYKEEQRTLLRRRRVYLAAPFTARAKIRLASEADAADLFAGSGSIETIPTGYRRALSSLAHSIESHGHDVLLPHRDINRWGKRSLPASEVAGRCFEALADSDCFIGLIGQSFGSHAELGFAIGMRKPTLLLITESEPTSFFGAGVAQMPNVETLRGKSIGALSKMLRAADPLARMRWRQK